MKFSRPEYWSFNFSISPTNEYSGLISLKINLLSNKFDNLFDIFAAQGSLKSLLQYYSSKVSILQYPAFFMVQLSQLYVTTRKTIALTLWTFVGKMISLLFKLWCWRRLLRVPWAARRSNQSVLKEINLEYSSRGLMLKLKLQNLGHLMQRP